ncbi:hypothetical protein Cpir12675_001163 [Ceratocystis pirilliformis]|uniref:Uncharacterized protein n=1 Tax=Ceratocystis pirilliformis TaxID=259994 RepID=A0ABR3ZIB7_9PEZI
MDSIVEMPHPMLPIPAAQDIDLMRYCNHIETSLRQENTQLKEKVSALELDLDDAKATRRKFQEEYNVLAFEH